MRDETIARNYAQALLVLATKAGKVAEFGALLDGTATAVREDVVFRRFLEAPQVPATAKREVLRKAFEGQAPRTFVLFLEKLVSNRRQLLIPAIQTEFVDLVDVQEGRVHATVTVSRPPQDGDAAEISRRLSVALGKTVVAHLTVNPGILGGLVVRIGDTVMDGSVRRRLGALRTALASAGQA
jgi:F-type H+-transporting ATPase subunit delta